LSIKAVVLSFNLPEASTITHVARPGFNQTNSNLSPSLPPRPPPYVYATFPHEEGGVIVSRWKNQVDPASHAAPSQAITVLMNDSHTRRTEPLLLSDWFRQHSCRPSAGQEFRFITCWRLQGRAVHCVRTSCYSFVLISKGIFFSNVFLNRY